MSHIFAIHELCSSLVATWQCGKGRAGWAECAPCPVSAYNATFGNIVAMQYPIVATHELYTGTLVALLPLAATGQSGLSVPLAPSLQIMRYSVA